MEKKNWNLEKNLVRSNNFESEEIEQINFQSNFDINKINTLFENLSSLTIWELKNLEDDFKSIGYSTIEIKIHNQKIISYPLFITLMALVSGIIMLNIRINKSNIKSCFIIVTHLYLYICDFPLLILFILTFVFSGLLLGVKCSFSTIFGRALKGFLK